MADAYIVEAVRTPTGRKGGGLAGVHPADLGAFVLRALLDRAQVDPVHVDDVIFGCVDQVGSQSLNIARQAWLTAGLPESVPGTTLDRQCGSSQQAAHFAAQGVMSGTYDLVVAGGVENMTMVPIGASAFVGVQAGLGSPFEAEGWRARYGEQEISQFRGAELIAEEWGLTREELEAYALESHRRAAAAWAEGRFDREVAAFDGVARDEGVRLDASLEAMAALPLLPNARVLTAALASQIADGAAALLIASEDAVRRHRLTPRARFHTLTVAGSDPVRMLTGPIPATRKALERSGLAIDDIDRFEVNEAFAPVPIVWARETGAPLEKTNVNGGAIALGHPLGATGAKLMTTLLHELERTGGRYGLQTMCEGGGMANATIVERIS
ncbi:MAG TPA: acetyl-CoA C-acetyltransferase [Gaiellaceae bacterium]|jgi:acetyl-CoA C-acetyltransferase|nr:acetyl-CoA C-acetyltransferase [Gaiellaceae bacterium]